jgi:ribonuclease T2
VPETSSGYFFNHIFIVSSPDQNPSTMQLTLLFALVALSLPCAFAYDFFVFANGWPGSTCLIADIQHHACNATIQPVEGFLVHGLWSENNDGTWPQFCNNSQPFDFSLISSLQDDLQHYWPSLYNAPDFLWSHEWEKHGTCAEDIFAGEYAFFAGVLKLRKSFDALAALKAAGIEPDDQKAVARSDVVAALTNGLKLPPNAVTMECFWDKSANQQLLSELRFCIGHDASLPFCSFPAAVTDSDCKEDTVVIPRFRW